MILADSGGAFAAVMAHVTQPRFADRAVLHVRYGPEQDAVPLTPAEAHRALHGDLVDQELAAAVWRDAIRAARSDDSPGRPWQLLLLWLALPRLTGTVRRIALRLRTGRRDLEAEMVATLLERLPTVDPEAPDAIGQLLRAARSSAWHYARSEARSFPTADIEGVAARSARPGDGDSCGEDEGHEHETDGTGGLAWEIAAPPDPAGLRASVRVTVSAEQVEGERLGALAKRLGLHDAVRQVRRPGRGRRVATLRVGPPRRRP
ncbi:hypothetical protein ACH4NF_19540 [Streptomyces sp. NPDC017248]|uniref:hypothetical protein n=1 Tax=unclassified Streptomyces TaxID=2593676 RepID=UPI00379A7F68